MVVMGTLTVMRMAVTRGCWLVNLRDCSHEGLISRFSRFCSADPSSWFSRGRCMGTAMLKKVLCQIVTVWMKCRNLAFWCFLYLFVATVVPHVFSLTLGWSWLIWFWFDGNGVVAGGKTPCPTGLYLLTCHARDVADSDCTVWFWVGLTGNAFTTSSFSQSKAFGSVVTVANQVGLHEAVQLHYAAKATSFGMAAKRVRCVRCHCKIFVNEFKQIQTVKPVGNLKDVWALWPWHHGPWPIVFFRSRGQDGGGNQHQ